MKVAIPVWQGNVSSVFDFAQRLLLVELKNRAEISRQELALTEQSAPERVARLRQLGVNVLICGAISRPLAYMLSGSGIQVLPFVAGSTEHILAAYKTGQLSLPQYALPGCWEGARRGFRRRRGGRGRRW
jgi:predicted Fe-Mo cluster-binding NifX family protein